MTTLTQGTAAHGAAPASITAATTVVVTTSETRRRPKSDGLVPREHGAWAMLGFPLATALAIGRIGPAPLAFAAAVVLAFVAHEPVLVLLGQRGARLARERGPAARRLLAWYAAALAVVAVTLVATAPWAAIVAGAVSAALVAPVAWLVVRREEKTAAGELLVGLALASASAPVAVAGGAALSTAALVAATWACVFAAGTLGVRAILARAKRKGAAPIVAAFAVLGVEIVAAPVLALAGPASLAPAASVLPAALASLGAYLSGAGPRDLKRLGWALVLSYVASFVWLVLATRLGS